MAIKKRGLGKGLDALFGEDVTAVAENAYTEASAKRASATGDVMLKLSLLCPNPDQPRKTFEPEALEELTQSIRQYGILTPLIVQKKGDMYEIIAGERRWRAAQAAGLKEVPVVIRDYDPQRCAEIAIVENLQREDLNAIEEAKAYQQLIDEFSLSQEEVATRVSKNRTTITNALRLLRLNEAVQQMVVDGALSSGHARALLALEDPGKQKELAEKICTEKLSVRETEKIVKAAGRKKSEPKKKPETDGRDYSIFYKDCEEKLREKLGTKVCINRKDNSKGRIEIDYYSQDELNRILETIL